MSKVVYELPVVALTEGWDAYKAAGGISRMFLADHNGYKRGDLVYWFDPEEKVSDFAFIDEFKVDGINEEGAPDVSFLLRLRSEETKELNLVNATIDDIVKIVGVISPACNWLEDGDEVEDSFSVALYAVPVGQPTLSVEGDDTVAIIPGWRITGVDTILMHNVIEIYNEHCFHYH